MICGCTGGGVHLSSRKELFRLSLAIIPLLYYNLSLTPAALFAWCAHTATGQWNIVKNLSSPAETLTEEIPAAWLVGKQDSSHYGLEWCLLAWGCWVRISSIVQPRWAEWRNQTNSHTSSSQHINAGSLHKSALAHNKWDLSTHLKHTLIYQADWLSCQCVLSVFRMALGFVSVSPQDPTYTPCSKVEWHHAALQVGSV